MSLLAKHFFPAMLLAEPQMKMQYRQLSDPQWYMAGDCRYYCHADLGSTKLALLNAFFWGECILLEARNCNHLYLSPHYAMDHPRQCPNIF